MKTGRTLMELAAEIERQNAAKKDYGADTRRLEMVADGSGAALVLNGTEIAPLPIRDIAHRQIGTYTEIPAKYYDRMRAETPELLADNVNTWLTRHKPEQRMIRTMDGAVRAFLSNRYNAIDNHDVANVVLPIIGEIPDARVESCEITERNMYIKVVNPRLTADVVPGDTVQGGIIISNSEVGLGSVSVTPLLYRLVCSNGMVVNDAAARKYHVGRGNEVDSNYEIYSDATRKADDNAFILKMQDTVRAAVDEVRFRRVVGMMQEAKGVKITGEDIPAVVELTAKSFGLSELEGKSVLNHLIQGSDLSLYGLANAVTRYSQDVETYDRATELEATGYSILTMAPALWAQLNRVR